MWAGHLRATPSVSIKGIRKGFCCGQDLESTEMMRILVKRKDVFKDTPAPKDLIWLKIFTTPENKTYVHRARLVLFEKINKHIK